MDQGSTNGVDTDGVGKKTQYFFFNVGQDFDPVLCSLAPGRSESCRHFRDLQKSIVILSNEAVWTRNMTCLIKTLPQKRNIDLNFEILALRRSETCG